MDIDENDGNYPGVTLTNLPAGATLSAGTLQADGSWLTSTQLVGLTLSVPTGTAADLSAKVSGIEIADGSQATTTAILHITAVNHAPVATNDGIITNERYGSYI